MYISKQFQNAFDVFFHKKETLINQTLTNWSIRIILPKKKSF